MLLEPELLERAFHSLAPEDRAEIFSVGEAFYRLNLAKKPERAERTGEAQQCCRRDLQAQADALVEAASQLFAQNK